MPIHVLEQQLPKEDTMKLDDAVIEGQEIDYSRFYDEKGNEYSSVSELVQTRLGLDDDDAIQEYNKENPSLPYIPYEKLRDMDKKDIPEMLSSVVDEADYVDAYKEVTHVASYHVEVTPMSNNYEAMGFAFTHQGLKEYEKPIDNHIFYPCRCYAHAGRNMAEKRVTSILSWSFCTVPVSSFCARISDGTTSSPPLSEQRRRCTNSTARSPMR